MNNAAAASEMANLLALGGYTAEQKRALVHAWALCMKAMIKAGQ